MKEYDAIVIGSGCGMILANEALAHGLKVALVDKGPLGGTCLNLGCIPSKILIAAADKVMEIQESAKLGVQARIDKIDFSSIMERMRDIVNSSQEEIRRNIRQSKALDFYEGVGSFTGDYTLEINGETIKGNQIFIASGARPFIPHIEGLNDIDYLTNETLLQLKDKPESLIIIGGGYIAVEYGHFFAAMGTRVALIEIADRLVSMEEPEISQILMQELARRMDIHIKTIATQFGKVNNSCLVLIKDLNTNQEKKLSAEKVLVAAGRIPNSDRLALEKTGVQTDRKGFILVNEYLETTKKNIYAVGDANGKQMFTHAANWEALLVGHNVMHNQWNKMDFKAVPHAIFTHPQIASVGLTEAEARKNHQVLIGLAKYSDQGMGLAIRDTTGFAKAIVEKDSEKILGFHILGPQAPTLIQEVTDAMTVDGTVLDIRSNMHVHPAMSEVVSSALANLK